MSHERERFEAIERAKRCGLSEADAVAVRRIALTLHRWFEMECGDSNDYKSWCIVRGRKEGVRPNQTFVYDDNGKPYMKTHYHQGESKAHYFPMADHETGARKRLNKIMSRYPNLRAYIQTDPRGGIIYLCKPEDATDELYTRGVFIA